MDPIGWPRIPFNCMSRPSDKEDLTVEIQLCVEGPEGPEEFFLSGDTFVSFVNQKEPSKDESYDEQPPPTEENDSTGLLDAMPF